MSAAAGTTRRRLARPGLIYWAGIAVMGTLGLLLALHAVGVLLDFWAALHWPLELDYGEGIVWQQALLMPGPRAYGTGQALPFIVFHYPPLYHMLVRGVGQFMPDMLMAGRLVSQIAALCLVPLVMGLVLVATASPENRGKGLPLVIAAVAGLLALCLHAVRTWGLVMRVDMVAIALGLAGVLVAAWADGRLWALTLGLLLCVAAAYTKQTQLSAGIAVFAVALVRRPRVALLAAGIAGGAGLVALLLLQAETGGGFLRNIVGYNINRYELRHAWWVMVPERSSLPFAVLMVVAAGLSLLRLWRLRAAGPRWRAAGQMLLMVRLLDRAHAARAMVLLHFGLASLMLFTVFKSGGNFNYLLEWLSVGSTLLGIWMCDLMATRRAFVAVATLMLLGVASLPFREMPDRVTPEQSAEHQAMVQRIREAQLPVASENMTMLMQAGKPVVFEPSIATELAEVGQWDETPLVEMIRARGFAFMITTDFGGRSTPAVAAAMHTAYPRVEPFGRRFFINLPP